MKRYKCHVAFNFPLVATNTRAQAARKTALATRKVSRMSTRISECVSSTGESQRRYTRAIFSFPRPTRCEMRTRARNRASASGFADEKKYLFAQHSTCASERAGAYVVSEPLCFLHRSFVILRSRTSPRFECPTLSRRRPLSIVSLKRENTSNILISMRDTKTSLSFFARTLY